MDWLKIIINIIWPIASAVTPLLFGVGFVWLKSQFPTRADFDALKAKIDTDIGAIRELNKNLESSQKLDTQRIERLEQDAEGSPTRIELMKAMSQIQAEQAHLRASVEAQTRATATLNDYLHMLVEKGLK